MQKSTMVNLHKNLVLFLRINPKFQKMPLAF